MQKYWHCWDKNEDLVWDFTDKYSCDLHNNWHCEVCTHIFVDALKLFPTDSEVIIAGYEYENYEGSAFVLYEKNGKLYEANGGHCSCYGLEGQWKPEETTWEALAMRKCFLSWNDCPFDEAVRMIVAQHV